MDARQHCKFIQIVPHGAIAKTVHAQRGTTIGLQAPWRLSCKPDFGAKFLNEKGFFHINA
ncbi:hypothetical protein E2H86_11650 [Pseudomonas putida]|nr:hypothetical protein E2H86_11650 [Pseudomonas putida]